MKVLLIRNGWTKNDFGGAEELLAVLAYSLKEHGVDAVVGTATPGLKNRCKELNVPAITTPYSSRQILTKHRFLFLPKYLLDLREAYFQYLAIFREENPDIVHATSQQDCIAATMAAKKLNIPILWSDHGELKNSLPISALPPWGLPGFLLKKAAGSAEAIIMVNPEDMKIVKKRLDCPVVRIPNGVLPLKTSLKKSYDLVFASRVIKEKGIFELLDAFEDIQSVDSSISLLISGDGPSLRNTKQLVKDRGLHNITFAPYSDKNIPRGKVFVLPTYTEAQSLALIKAAMLEQVIVTTNIPGNTHFLKDGKNCILVEPKNSISLRQGLESALHDKPLRKQLIQGVKHFFANEGNVHALVKSRYIPLYKKILAKNK